MTPERRLSHLIAVRDEIAAFSVAKCRMAHERVVRADGSGLPIGSRLTRGNYQRVGLCAPEVRMRRLGCGHTMARYRLEAAIRTLDGDVAGPGGGGALLDSELNWLNNEIHLLDHRKGEAEKTLARVLEQVASGDVAGEAGAERLQEAEDKVRALETLHDDYVDQVSVLRDKLVAELDTLITQTKRNSDVALDGMY